MVVVDNCSTDETARELASWAQRWPALRVERLDSNTGFSVASNHGARISSAPLLLFLNNDTEPTAGWLEPLIGALNDPAVGIVGPKLVYPDGTINHAGYGFRYGGFVPMYVGHDGATPGANKTRDYQALLGACFLMRRELFFEVGEFSLDGLEDVDLCLKVRERGLASRYLPASTVVHHGSVTLRQSPSGSFPITDNRGFLVRWAHSNIKVDEHVWYLEDGVWPLPAACDGRAASERVQESILHFVSARSLAAAGRFDEALSECGAAESAWPLNPLVYVLKCSLFVAARQLDAAAQEIGRQAEFGFYSRLGLELLPIVNQLTAMYGGASARLKNENSEP